ncbi:hypothetical protein [Oleiagrimonas soli]|uniref:Uncharacterized protein n=1 Tax=Oleiagrimonas soli TaxID=1543381 RepID=A0A841KHH7_9GAMM|nr:hypothetical protein [Oleiagrimonas soli]MBB6184505.1 hypothetical protein [Oleiagrimonas soli]
MKMLKWKLFMATALALAAACAQAKSTTVTSLSIDGKTIPGQTINLHIILTGKHLVYAGGCSFYPGEIKTSKDNTNINVTNPTTQNSNTISTETVPAASGTGCYDSTTGLWYAVKVYGDHTDFFVPYKLPTGVATYQFSATFSGDSDSNGSNASPVTVHARYPNNAAVMNFFLSD